MFLALALLGILIATLWPFSGSPAAQWLGCLACGARGTADLLLNVILFLPFGAALARAGQRVGRSSAAAALLSLIIEVAQLYIPGRDTSLGDVAANTLGGTLGAILALTAAAWLFPPPGRARRWSRGAAACAAGLCGLTGLLLAPAFPASRYHGLWTPWLARLERYEGRVLSATLAERPIRPGPLDSPGVRALLEAEHGFRLHVRAEAGAPPAGLAPLFAIYDDARREILLLGVDHHDIVVRVRTRAAAVRLDQPDVRVRDALLGIDPGDSLDLTVMRTRSAFQVSLNATTERLGFTVGSGWSLVLYPEGTPGWLRAALNALWTGLLFAPAGWWLRTRGDGLVALAAIAAGLLAAPALTPLIATPAREWAGAVLGLIAGVGLH
ncbi:MAG: VanZ family protein, partial [Gemmatimonadales bacterium]